MAAAVTARDAKLIQYLNEAYGKEKQLETGLQAHIAMTTRAPYKKRLQAHLKETKQHAREVERRIKKLGGVAETVPVPDSLGDRAAGVAQAALTSAQKGAALVQGQLHMLRGTGEQEKLLKNAKSELTDEAEEIANYTAIETLATLVGDRDTAKLARSIRREEERMYAFIEKEIPKLVKAVAQDEIPAAERRPQRRRTTGRTGSQRSSATTRRSTSGGGRAASGGRATSARSGGSSGSSRASSGSRSASGSRSGASGSRSGGTRSGGGSSRRSTRSSGRSSGGSRAGRSRSS